MAHKQFQYNISKDLEVTVHFDIEFNGVQMIASNIEFGNKTGKIGTITTLVDEVKITSHNPVVFDQNVMKGIIKQMAIIMEEETPRFEQ